MGSPVRAHVIISGVTLCNTGGKGLDLKGFILSDLVQCRTCSSYLVKRGYNLQQLFVRFKNEV
jgi:hypothetical protein